MRKKEIWIGRLKFQITIFFSAPILFSVVLSPLNLIPVAFYFAYLLLIVNGVNLKDAQVICYNFYNPWDFKQVFDYGDLISFEFVKNRYGLFKSGLLYGYSLNMKFIKSETKVRAFCYYVSHARKDEIETFITERFNDR